MRRAAFVAPCKCCKISTESKFQDNYVIMNHRLLEEQRSTSDRSDTFIVPSPPPLTQNICTKFGRGGGLPPWVALWLLMLLTNCRDTTNTKCIVSANSHLLFSLVFITSALWPGHLCKLSHRIHCLLRWLMFIWFVLCFIQKCKCMMQCYFSSGFQTLIIIIRVHFESFAGIAKI